MNLYEINAQLEDLLTMSDENGELSEQAFQMIEALQIEESVKIDNIACFIKELKAESEAIKSEIKALTDRKKHKEAKQERLETYLSDYLQFHGHKKFETARAVISFRKSTRVEVTDEDAIMRYANEHQDLGLTKIDIHTSKTAIGSAIKSGMEIPGASLIEAQSLQIK